MYSISMCFYDNSLPLLLLDNVCTPIPVLFPRGEETGKKAIFRQQGAGRLLVIQMELACVLPIRDGATFGKVRAT